VSGRFDPRNICVQLQLPIKKLIEEKSGFAAGTGVYDGAGWADETAGTTANATMRAIALSTMEAMCFIN
jgi:hypothetical protein